MCSVRSLTVGRKLRTMFKLLSGWNYCRKLDRQGEGYRNRSLLAFVAVNKVVTRSEMAAHQTHQTQGFGIQLRVQPFKQPDILYLPSGVDYKRNEYPPSGIRARWSCKTIVAIQEAEQSIYAIFKRRHLVSIANDMPNLEFSAMEWLSRSYPPFQPLLVLPARRRAG